MTVYFNDKKHVEQVKSFLKPQAPAKQDKSIKANKEKTLPVRGQK